MSFKNLCSSLEEKIKNSYENGVTTDQAEKLAGEFLAAQMSVSNELKNADLDSRMRKSGLKGIRAAIYMDSATKTDKKPSDVMLEAIVNMNELVQKEQDSFDKSEVERDNLERWYNIFREAHLHFRTIAKGKFE